MGDERTERDRVCGWQQTADVAKRQQITRKRRWKGVLDQRENDSNMQITAADKG